jgi:hypothetical protein
MVDPDDELVNEAMRDVAGLVLLFERGDTEGANLLGPEAVKNPKFVPAVVSLVLKLAHDLADATGQTAEDILQHLAEAAAAGDED